MSVMKAREKAAALKLTDTGLLLRANSVREQGRVRFWGGEGGQEGSKKGVDFTKSYPQLRSESVDNCSPKVYQVNTALFT